MPNDDPYTAVLAKFAEVVDALRLHKDVVNRAIGHLNQEVVSFSQRLDKDDAARVKRQQQLDEVLNSITNGQNQIRHWQWVRLAIEIAAILIVAAYLYGVSR